MPRQRVDCCQVDLALPIQDPVRPQPRRQREDFHAKLVSELPGDNLVHESRTSTGHATSKSMWSAVSVVSGIPGNGVDSTREMQTAGGDANAKTPTPKTTSGRDCLGNWASGVGRWRLLLMMLVRDEMLGILLGRMAGRRCRIPPGRSDTPCAGPAITMTAATSGGRRFSVLCGHHVLFRGDFARRAC